MSSSTNLPRQPTTGMLIFYQIKNVKAMLAVNFVRFNSNYENFDSSEPWADRSLRIHLAERKYLYTEQQLENAETHDPLCNEAGSKTSAPVSTVRVFAGAG